MLLAALDPGSVGVAGKLDAEPFRALIALILGVLFIGFFLFLSIWPAALVLGTVASILRIRTWLYYALGGVLAGLIGAWLITLNPDTLVQEVEFSNRTAFANMAIGALMATVYWFIVHKYGEHSGPGAEDSKAKNDAADETDDTGQALLELHEELENLPPDTKPKSVKKAEQKGAEAETKDEANNPKKAKLKKG